MKTTDTVDSECWACKVKFEAATDILGDRKPQEGDASVCLKCSALGIFEKDLSVRKPTEKEMAEYLKSGAVAASILVTTMYQMEKGL